MAEDKTFIVDLSHWETISDYGLLFANSPACIYKATEGTGFIDPQFYLARGESIRAGHPWAAYHFFRNGLDPVAQARHFANVVGAGCNRYYLDIETLILQDMIFTGMISETGVAALRSDPQAWGVIKSASGGKFLNSQTSGIVDNMKRFLDTLEATVNKRPAIYTSPGFWNYNVIPTPPWTSNYDLWVAHYTIRPYPDIPNGWTSYKIWQYTDSAVVPGVEGHADGDWYNGDLAECVDYFGNGTPPPDPEPCFPKARTLTALKVRSGPGVGYTYWFVESQGTVVDVIAKKEYDPNNIWLQVGRRQWMAMKHQGYIFMEWIE